MAILTGNAVQYGAPLYNQYGDQSETTAVQSDVNAIVKVRFGSASTVNQAVTGGSSSTGFINGTEVNMGVPQKSTNWYRIYYQTVADDSDGSVSGWGIMLWRYTPSSGWTRILSQGQHASYDNNFSDWYRSTNGIFWAPVHQSYPNEEHSFRLYWEKHDSGSIRINCDIGSDLRRNGWTNNQYEVWEVDSQKIVTTGTLTAY